MKRVSKAQLFLSWLKTTNHVAKNIWNFTGSQRLVLWHVSIAGIYTMSSFCICGLTLSFHSNFRSLKRILFLGSVWLFILFVVVPTVFRSCSTLQRHMVFLPYGKSVLGWNVLLTLSIDIEGVWNVLPSQLQYTGPSWSTSRIQNQRACWGRAISTYKQKRMFRSGFGTYFQGT